MAGGPNADWASVVSESRNHEASVSPAGEIETRRIRRRSLLSGVGATAGSVAGMERSALAGPRLRTDRRPNLVFIMADDLARRAVSAYGGGLPATPNIDRLAHEGVLFQNAFCTNSLCAPSRATFLTGTYSHVNGVTSQSSTFDARQPSYPGLLRTGGYQTALFGKWHLGHGGVSDPRGFDHWEVLPGQGRYLNPRFLTPQGATWHRGYVTDVVTDRALRWLSSRDPRRPFCLLIHHKTPHSPFIPPIAAPSLTDAPEPATLRDDYANRADAAAAATIRIAEDLRPRELKEPVPDGLTPDQALSWKYHRFMEDYLRCVRSLDHNVGRVLRALDRRGLTANTMVVLTSDQGFFLGEHGWFDKRFMFEPSLRIPLLVRHPRSMPAGHVVSELVLNLDVAQTLLHAARLQAPERMQGRSLLPLLRAAPVTRWRSSMYYRYWMHDDALSHVRAHYGVRTERFKLIYYYSQGLGQPGASSVTYPPQWELFDLADDPDEMQNRYADPTYSDVRSTLEVELNHQQSQCGDHPAT